MNSWQPIETAPKDGTQILVCWINYKGEGRQSVVRWTDEYGGEGHRWLIGMSLPKDEQRGVALQLVKRHPTHWQPIPDFPKAGE